MDIVKANKLVTFCSTDEFKKLVQEAVNDRLFWNNIIQQLSLENLVQKEIALRLPSQEKTLRDKIKLSVNDMVAGKLRDFQRDQIPLTVAKELCGQITAFLTNHVQMSQIIQYHSDQLNLRLTETATRTLNKLVNEPEYHMTTTAHLNAISQKGDLKILEIQSDCNQQLNTNNLQFAEQLRQLKNTNDKELDELKDNLTMLKSLNKEFNNYKMFTSNHERCITLLNDKVTTLQWLLGTCIFAFSGALYLMRR